MVNHEQGPDSVQKDPIQCIGIEINKPFLF